MRLISLLAGALALCAPAAAQIDICGIVYDNNAFPDAIQNVTGGPASFGGGALDILDAVDGDVNSYMFGTPVTFEALFLDNVLVNGPGEDLGVYELGIDDGFAVEAFSGGVWYGPVSYIRTGLGCSGGGFSLTGSFVNLDDLGVPAGAQVSMIRLNNDSLAFGGQTISAAFCAVGCINNEAGDTGLDIACDPAVAHSGGTYAKLDGSDMSGPGIAHLECTDGPANQFGYFLVSGTLVDPGVPVASGLLCLGGPIGRYISSSGGSALASLGSFDAAGVLQNLSGTSTVGSGYDVFPTLPNPLVGTIGAGSTWHFQCWFRDVGGTSNFSNVASGTF